jgi:hypothetical protein
LTAIHLTKYKELKKKKKDLSTKRIIQLINGQINHCQKKQHKIANKHMKKCSISLAIKEMQIKTPLRFHLTPIRMEIMKETKGWA